MDELEKRFFSSPDLYGKAIELLAKYQNVVSGFVEARHFGCFDALSRISADELI